MTPVMHLPGGRGFASVPGVLPVVLVLAGVGSVMLVGLAVAAFTQRRSHSYLLVTLALATLLTRTVVGGLAVEKVLPMGIHHTAEHALDILMAGLLIAAVYCARTVEQSLEEEHA